jgi:CheY-like chemotaxis protein
VRAESPGKGHGSTFYVTLPVHALTPDVEPPDADTPQPEPASLRRKTPDALHNVRVLVVDDDGDARALLREVFLAAGAVVETASSAPSAFTTFRTFRPDLLVSDIGMPGEDGYSLIRRIRALPLADGGSVPAIALTAYVRQDDQSAAVDAGFTMHVGKPVDPGDLLTTASRLLGQPSA